MFLRWKNGCHSICFFGNSPAFVLSFKVARIMEQVSSFCHLFSTVASVPVFLSNYSFVTSLDM